MACLCPGEDQKCFVLIDVSKLQCQKVCVLLALCESPAAWALWVLGSIFKSNYACDNIVLSLKLLTWILTKA